MGSLYISGTDIVIEVGQLSHDAIISGVKAIARSDNPVRQFGNGRMSLLVDFSKVAVVEAHEENPRHGDKVITVGPGMFNM
jgi:hypothetical protein